MAIKYFPNRVYKGQVPAIDRVLAKKQPITVTGAANTTSVALDAVISSNDNWQLDALSFTFDSATPRNFYAYIQNGRKVVANLNDFLWIQVPGDAPQLITLAAGFYNGTNLAIQLKAQLDVNTAFVRLGASPFTVAYSAITGLFTITPAAGQIRYLDVATQATLSTRQSIAGHLIGLTADSVYGASVASDTAVYGLNTEIPFVSQATSSILSYYTNTIQPLSIDQSIHLTSSVAAVVINYEATYEVIV